MMIEACRQGLGIAGLQIFAVAAEHERRELMRFCRTMKRFRCAASMRSIRRTVTFRPVCVSFSDPWWTSAVHCRGEALSCAPHIPNERSDVIVRRIFQDFVRRSHLRNLAVFQDCDAVADAECFVEVMRNE